MGNVIKRTREAWDKLMAGTNSKAIPCPFHDEETPSMVVSGDKYHCLSCGESGNTAHIQNYIDWIEKI